MEDKFFLMTIAISLITISSVAQVKGTFKDTRDGKVYRTVTIGKQVWIAENLKYLPSVVGPDSGSREKPFYYVYGYDGTSTNAAKATSNFTTYGVLYNWPAAMNGATSSKANPSGVQGICPKGWHLPSDDEWTELTDYLGGTSVAGGKLKEDGTIHWYSPNAGASNSSGFTALPGGYRFTHGYFDDIGVYGTWWSATEDRSFEAIKWNAYYKGISLVKIVSDKQAGHCVRCLKD